MSIKSLVLRGVPPVGVGAYLRDELIVEPFDFRAVNAARSDAGDMARAAMQLGPTWLYTGPESWTPARWREELPRIVELAQALGVEGIIADAENDWTTGNGDDARELGRALAGAADAVRVGFTSHPSFPVLEQLAGGAGDAIWWSVQIYGRTANDATAFTRWAEGWASVVGRTRLTLSIAGWNVTDAHRTPAGFQAYLDRLPRIGGGAIAWLGTGQLPEHIGDALSRFEPGGSALGTYSRAALSFVWRPIGAALIAAVVILLVLVVASIASSSSSSSGGAG